MAFMLFILYRTKKYDAVAKKELQTADRKQQKHRPISISKRH